jgi:hypothetical protein
VRVLRLNVLAFLFVLLAACAQGSGLVPIEAENGKLGYADAQGNVVIAPRFEIAEEFSKEGIAAVIDGQGWALIDTQGRVLVRPFIVDNGPDYFEEGLARFLEGDKMGFFNRTGQVVIPARFDAAFPFHDGLAAVCVGARKVKQAGQPTLTEGGQWGYIDRKGEVVIPPRFDFATPFYEDLAAVCEGCREVALGEHTTLEGGRWGYIDRKGQLAIPIQFDYAWAFEEGKARVRLKGKPASIDRKGKVVEQGLDIAKP